MSKHVFEAIGTHWEIDVFELLTPLHEEELITRIKARIDEFDRAYSRFRDDSLVTEMSRRAGVYTLPRDAKPMLDLYRDLYRLTDGLVTPLIGDTLVEAGYDAEYSLQSKTVRAARGWDEVLRYDFPLLTLKSPAVLDFGAAGKGYLIDIVSEILHTEGVKHFCVDAGGDMFYSHPENKLLEVALENPNDTSEAIGIATIANESICGSAGNRRAWGEYHHIINPKSARSPKDIAAIWTVADQNTFQKMRGIA
jgi:thiamine biosynthesis lipoprotein